MRHAAGVSTMRRFDNRGYALRRHHHQRRATSAGGGAIREVPGSARVGEQVKAGKLPPVEQRLPEQPLVVPVVEKIGEYGGVWRRAFLGPADANNYVRVVYDGLFRFAPDGAQIEPKLAVGAKSSPDFKVWTIRGARGRPLVRRRAVHRGRHRLLVQGCPANHDLTPSLPSWIRNTDGSAAKSRRSTTPPSSSPTTAPPRCFSPKSPTRTAPMDHSQCSCRRIISSSSTPHIQPRLTSIAWHRLRASRPGPNCSPRGPRPTKTRRVPRWRRGCRSRG